MAGDWIKMRTDLYRDPKVSVMASFLFGQESELAQFISQNCQRDMTVTSNVTRNAAVGALVAVWGVSRHRGKRIENDLLLSGVSIHVLDDIADLPGFGDAMAHVGWAVETQNGVVFPNFFEEFNVSPDEDAKAKAAERQRRFRQSKRNALRDVTVASQSNDRAEKSREEQSIKQQTAVPDGTKALLASERLEPNHLTDTRRLLKLSERIGGYFSTVEGERFFVAAAVHVSHQLAKKRLEKPIGLFVDIVSKLRTRGITDAQLDIAHERIKECRRIVGPAQDAAKDLARRLSGHASGERGEVADRMPAVRPGPDGRSL